MKAGRWGSAAKQKEWRREGTGVRMGSRKWGDRAAAGPKSLPVIKGLISYRTVIHKLLHLVPP